jgi:hypothetical protein
VIEAEGEYRLVFSGGGESARLVSVEYMMQTGH